jgi:hypothetical protein
VQHVGAFCSHSGLGVLVLVDLLQSLPRQGALHMAQSSCSEAWALQDWLLVLCHVKGASP